MKVLVIIGASGHGKVVADIAEKTGKYNKIVFLDDSTEKNNCMGYSVVGKSDDIQRYIGKADFFVAIGNAMVREKIMSRLTTMHADIPTLIHPNAVIGSCVQIGKGTVVMAGAVVNPDSMIGEGCIVNTCASVDHDCNLEDYVHIAVGAHLCGTVHVGKSTWIGAGATVKNNTKICGDCMIGAGAVVVKDIEEAGTYMGIPARKMCGE